MKRAIFVALLFVLGVAHTATAQTPPAAPDAKPMQGTLAKGMPLSSALAWIATSYDVKVYYGSGVNQQDGLENTVTLTGSETLLDALQKIMPSKYSFTAGPTTKTVLIEVSQAPATETQPPPAAPSPATAPSPDAATPPATPVAQPQVPDMRRAAIASLLGRFPDATAQLNSSREYQDMVEGLLQQFPQAYGTDGLPGNFLQLDTMKRQLNQFAEARQMALMTAAVQPATYQAGYAYPSAGRPVPGAINGSYYQPADGYFNPFAIRDLKNAEMYGLLKIDGPDKFLQNVRVVIDGRDMAVASKANNAWNKPVILPVGPHVVEFVLEADGQIQAFRRDVEIVSVAVQHSIFHDSEPQWLRVSGNEFKNAREVYDYQQHRYVESPKSSQP